MEWDELHHAHGRATDVPKYLEALRNGDAQAISELYSTVAHQGTRWQASCHAVAFLVELVDDPRIQHRVEISELVRYIAVGDSQLPFDSSRYAVDLPTDEQVDTMIQQLYHEENPEPEFGEEVALRWEADAYHAAAEHLGTYVRWLADPEVGSHAAALLAWFPLPEDATRALVDLPADSPARASANLALAYITSVDASIDLRLRELLAAPRPVSLTAAIALAFRVGDRVPLAALDVLADEDLPETPAGWDRSMRGFVAMALKNVGL
ncbi:hypothetical protein [Kibdelosporangium aridum]|uniref:HEAT repeat domain-containing protein n=1 Tax=Kibdelosporangium aridum TaxID=2030 RepID=A0A1Y5X3I4_KIBAR|nr:hypothetical protein [Kibdelosporangium aridum]SMC69489.1 hypothetical protein SAMN05661093_01464 [Kibdelosporangium aridum]